MLRMIKLNYNSFVYWRCCGKLGGIFFIGISGKGE